MVKKEQFPNWGLSLWMDNHSRESLHGGSFMHYLEKYCITGVSLSSHSLQKAVVESSAYDDAIRSKLGAGIYGEPLAYSLVIDDVRLAADLLRHVHDRTEGVDGWVCLPASPLASDGTSTLSEVFLNLRENVNRPNALVGLPATPERVHVIEKLVYQGVPINITNIFTPLQFSTVADACLRGVERRIEEHLKPGAPVFISVGIVQLEKELSRKMEKQKAVENAYRVAEEVYATMRILHTSSRWEATYNTGARPLRLVWNCSVLGDVSDRTLVTARKVRAPCTTIILPRQLIPLFFTSDEVNSLPVDLHGHEKHNPTESCFNKDIETVASELQDEVVTILRNSWIMMLEGIARKSAWIVQQNALQKKGEYL